MTMDDDGELEILEELGHALFLVGAAGAFGLFLWEAIPMLWSMR